MEPTRDPPGRQSVCGAQHRDRGRPTGKFFGVEPKAGFEIMTIDIHEVRGGKIVKSYHVEDWARAIRQVSSGK